MPRELPRTYRLIKKVVPAPALSLLIRLLPNGLERRVNKVVDSRLLAPLERFLARRSEAQQRNTRPHVKREQLIDNLENCGFPHGCAVFVHSSLKSLGYVVGGAATVIDALQDVVVQRRGGTIAMPAFSLRGTMYDTLRSGQTFSPKTSPSTMGAITEAFRTHPRVVRSVHPTHSVAAQGARAAWLVDGHARGERTFGEGSPFAKLLEADGYLLGLAIDLGPVTFYHVIEDLRPDDFPLRVYTKDSPLEAICYDDAGHPRRIKVMAHDPDIAKTRIDRPDGEWIRSYITRYLEEQRGLRWVRMGTGRAWVIHVRDMYRALEDLMSRSITIYSSREQVEALVSNDEVTEDRAPTRMIRN